MKKGNCVLKETDFLNLEENQIAVGISFIYMRQMIQSTIEYNGNTYRRLHSVFMPNDLSNEYCSIQIYELVK